MASKKRRDINIAHPNRVAVVAAARNSAGPMRNAASKRNGRRDSRRRAIADSIG